jgi:hypothetical protein
VITSTPSVLGVSAVFSPSFVPRRSLSTFQVLVAMIVCLLLWGFVDSPALLRSARTGPLGTRRSVSIAVLEPVARVASFLGIDRVVHLSDSLLGHHHPAVAAAAPGLVLPPPVVVAPAPPPVVTFPHLRIPTVAAPLRVLVVGDSLGLTFGQSTATKLDAGGLATTSVDAREGTGLSRPDAFDWPAQLRADIVRFHPELIVASFGGNDDQDVLVNGHYVPFASPAWNALYEGRVRSLAAAAHAANAYLVYSGLPVMRSAGLTARLVTVMNLTRSALAGVQGTLFVDNMATLATASGGYTDTLTSPGGNAVLVRQPDGIHETSAGADRLAAHAITALDAAWHEPFAP